MSTPKIGRALTETYRPDADVVLAASLEVQHESASAPVLGFSASTNETLPPPHTLDQCAEAVVAQLDGPLAEYVREIAMIHQRIPLWALVAGCLNAAYEHGTLSTPILSPSWPRSFVGVGLDLTTLTYDCRWCQQAFTPQRYKQGYCSQDCGTLAAKAQAEAEREAARLAVAHG